LRHGQKSHQRELVPDRSPAGSTPKSQRHLKYHAKIARRFCLRQHNLEVRAAGNAAVGQTIPSAEFGGSRSVAMRDGQGMGRRHRRQWMPETKGKHRDGAQGRDRTTDTAIFSRMLYQLSYLGVLQRGAKAHQAGGL
jgi:hypothetical protein